MKHLVLILGMHRSGTSTLTGILNKMGLELGGNLMKATSANPKGYFENMDFFVVNEQILRNCRSTWFNVNNVFNNNLLLNLQNKQILKNVFLKYSNYEIFGLKDPRICVLLPLYEHVCKELGIKITYIYTEINKDSVDKSITKRDRLPANLVYDLIEKHKERIHTKDFEVQYEDLLSKPLEIIESLNKEFDFLNLKNKKDILEFIDPKLNRNG